MPVDDNVSSDAEAGDKPGKAHPGEREERGPAKHLTDAEMLKDQSVITTCGSDALAEEALEVFKTGLETGKLKFNGHNFTEDSFVKVLKCIGIFAKLKGLVQTRSAVLPINEVDFSGITLYNEVPGDVNLKARWDQKRRAQTIQIAVQFVRVSTGAKIVKMEDCNLQGSTHDKEDLIEQEVVRLVKKFGFGSGKDARYTEEVSLANNRFEDTLAKKIIEAAYWERCKHPEKDAMPRLSIDLSGNKIRMPRRIVSELRQGHCAGGPISVATKRDTPGDQEKATIVVDFGNSEERSASPLLDPPPQTERPQRAGAGAAERLVAASSAPAAAARRAPAPAPPPRRRQVSPRDACEGHGGGRRRRRRDQSGGGGGKRRRGGGGTRRHGGGARRRGEGGRRRRGGAGGRQKRRRERRRTPSPSSSYYYSDDDGSSDASDGGASGSGGESRVAGSGASRSTSASHSRGRGGKKCGKEKAKERAKEKAKDKDGKKSGKRRRRDNESDDS